MANTNISKVIAALNKKVEKGAERAIKVATREVAVVATAEMKGLIDKKRPYVGKGRSKRYEKGSPPEPPQNRTGNLRRSIRFKVEQESKMKYVATIAPYAIYSRALEKGHPRWASGTRYPFVEPTARIMKANNRARNIYLKALRAELSK